jgi:hypothetical protein
MTQNWERKNQSSSCYLNDITDRHKLTDFLDIKNIDV